jgi:hypothetical protein
MNDKNSVYYSDDEAELMFYDCDIDELEKNETFGATSTSTSSPFKNNLNNSSNISSSFLNSNSINSLLLNNDIENNIMMEQNILNEKEVKLLNKIQNLNLNINVNTIENKNKKFEKDNKNNPKSLNLNSNLNSNLNLNENSTTRDIAIQIVEMFFVLFEFFYWQVLFNFFIY